MTHICLMIMVILTIASCGTSLKDTRDTETAVILPEGNSARQINDKLRYSRLYQEATPEQVIGKISTSFRVPENNGPLALGSSLENEFAWLYLEVPNPEKKESALTLITKHTRCDRLELFAVKGDQIADLGYLQRSTPISARPYMSPEFAFPVRISAGDTARILMRTTRLLGAMEVDFSLYNETAFLKQQYFSRLWDTFTLAFILVIGLLSFTTGLVYQNGLMRSFGAFLFCTFLVYSFLLNFWDGFELPDYSGLRSYNVGSFFAVVQGAFFHPFGNSILKSYGIMLPVYRRISIVLMALNSIVALSILIAAPWTEALFVRSYAILTLFNIACLLFITLKIYRHNGEKWLLAIAILAIAPTLIYLPLRLFHFSEQFYAAVVAPNIIIITIALAYFTVKQLLRQLTSKAELERRLTEIKMEMNDMRREEVQKIGRNLHDQLGNTLASALGYINIAIPDLDQIRKLLKQAIQEIRFTSHNLVKNEDLPLSVKMAGIVERFNDFSAIHFRFYDYSNGKTDQLDEIQQQNIYLIIQELMTNAVRHSKASEMVVQSFGQDNEVQFSIEEDGKGFDPAQETDGLGIKNIHKRAELSDLNLTIESSAGNGTNVIIIAKTRHEHTL